jgi:hypothetical protein
MLIGPGVYSEAFVVAIDWGFVESGILLDDGRDSFLFAIVRRTIWIRRAPIFRIGEPIGRLIQSIFARNIGVRASGQ